jgi:predicted anti-sigma-YlaC factor YlaD
VATTRRRLSEITALNVGSCTSTSPPNNNISPVLRDDRAMECEVAREALSARLDGKREPVPTVRVDEHLGECAACRAWFVQAASEPHGLRRLVQSRLDIAPLVPLEIECVSPQRRSWMTWQRSALLCAGAAQTVMAIGQGVGFSVELTRDRTMISPSHLTNESTSWSIALGIAMVGAALWSGGAAGIAGVLTVFAAVLTVDVFVDALSGTATTRQMLTHLPVMIGAVLAIMVWRSRPAPRPTPDNIAAEPDIVLPQNASRRRRRGHL